MSRSLDRARQRLPSELHPGRYEGFRVAPLREDAALPGDAGGGPRPVAGHHADGDSSPVALQGDGLQ